MEELMIQTKQAAVAIFISLAGLILSGCEQGVSFAHVPENPPPSEPLGPLCVVDATQMKLDGVVVSFEATSGFSLNLGYGRGGEDLNDKPVNGAVRVKVSKSQMDLLLIGTHPLTRAQMASAEVGPNQTRTTIGVEVDFGDLSAIPEHYKETPLSEVSRKALTKGLEIIKDKLDRMPWSGSVMQVIGKSDLLINAGTRAGVRVGDTFEIYNLQHAWEGEACSGTYKGSWREPVAPVATIQIRESRDTTSVGTIIKGGNVPVIRGAEVIAKELVPDPKAARYLKKKIVLGKIVAAAFLVPGGIFDLERALNDQVVGVLDDAGSFVFDVKK
jgi:hypothetical protein